MDFFIRGFRINGGRVPRVERRKQARSNPFPSRRTTATMAENWVDERDKAILETIYYCENCNMVLEPDDSDVERHKKDLPNHKMRKVFIVRCRSEEHTSELQSPMYL